MPSVLIANRGEIAIRIARSLAELGWHSIAVFSEDDANSLHLQYCDEKHPLNGQGAAAYLDIENLLDIARHSGADAVHPGYGFLSERADFALACAEAEIQFIGPDAHCLTRFGDKLAARRLARDCGLPLTPGVFEPCTREQAEQLLRKHPEGIMVKAVHGGGGRGMRKVTASSQLESAWKHCQSEAHAAFGAEALYAEALLPAARHIEVQLAGDGRQVVVLGDRDCSLQHRFQKVLEVAPAPALATDCREALYDYARCLGEAVSYRGLGTVEFMVWNGGNDRAFIEFNPRIQVEHTVTEETTGLDLVRLQCLLAMGQSLEQLALLATPSPRGMAIQSRICIGEPGADGTPVGGDGTLTVFDPPAGHGIRVDHCAYRGYTGNPRFDPLIAKLITRHEGDFDQALTAHLRYLARFRLDGTESNLGFLQRLLDHPSLGLASWNTEFVSLHADSLFVTDPGNADDTADSDGSLILHARMQGMVIAVNVAAGDVVLPGHELLVLDSMKLEHPVVAPCPAKILRINVATGDTVRSGQTLILLQASGSVSGNDAREQPQELDKIRPDLEEVLQLHAYGHDEQRPDAIAKLHHRGKQSARENIAQLTAGGDFIEYGALAIAAQRGRRKVDDLRRNTPADGLITGVGEVNRPRFDAESARTAIFAYDYSVLAGTQGFFNHAKTDRLVEVIDQAPMPLVMFAEGGGGRPGDVDMEPLNSTGLGCTTFANLAALNSRVPMIGINAGYCFAGNAAFLAMNHLIIATRDSWLGMGGPAMIEGGGLGTVDKQAIGPSDVQSANGTIDILVETEQEAVAMSRRVLAYFQGDVAPAAPTDQRWLRQLVPENRNRAFDMRRIVQSLADADSVLELRPFYAEGMLTSLCRIDGKTTAIVANNNSILSGAIDAEGARKADRFLRLCEQFQWPVLFLVDCPGLMVGPEYDAQGTARAAGDLYITAAKLSVPTGAIIIRKAYGLGAMAAMGGSSRAARFCVSWPTGECGPMGIEGAIRLGFKKELESIADKKAREQAFRERVNTAWQQTRAIHGASTVEIDAVIDPAESRRWIRQLLR